MYFQDRLKGTQWSDCIENYVTFAFQACSVTVQLLLTAYPRDLIFPMLLVNTIVFACCLAMVFATMPGTTFFVLTIVCAMLAGITCAGIQAGVYGIGGTLPPRYTQAIMSGQVIPPIGAEGLNRRPPAGACRLFLGPWFRLADCWNRLVETVKARKKREKTGEKWARYGLKGVKEGS